MAFDSKVLTQHIEFAFYFIVLSHGEAAIEYANETIGSINSTELLASVSRLCGANYCPGEVTADVNPNLTLPDSGKIQTLMLIFFGMMIVACLLISFGVDGLKRYEMGRKGSGSELSGIRLLSVTVKQLLQIKQILLLPITMFIGVEQAFMAVDFTSVRASATFGISKYQNGSKKVKIKLFWSG